MSENDSGAEEYENIKGLEWLRKAGVAFTADGYPVFLKPVNQIIAKLQKFTEKKSKDELDAETKKFSEYLTSPNGLKYWLRIPKGALKSLPSILMENKCFQLPVIQYLCQYIAMTSIETSMEIPTELTNAILRDMKYHTRIFDNDKVATCLFDAIGSAKDTLQPLLLASLNEIIDCSSTVVHSLLDMMVRTPALTKDILGAFEGFQLTDEEKKEIREKVLSDTLQAVTPSHLNVVIQFLMDTTDKTNAKETVDTFRENMVISTDPDSTDDSDVFLILILKNSLKVNTEFATQYMKAIIDELELKITDVWVLFCMFDITSRRNETKQAITKMIHSNSLNESILTTAIHGHEKALQNVMRPITDLLSWMLESTIPEVLQIGDVLAVELFKEIEHPGVQQDIIASLLQQVGIGDDANKENAIRTLNQMSIEMPEKMSFHIHILEAPLYSFQSMDLSIFKTAVSIIVRLTFVDQQSIEANSGSQLHVFLRKMLNKTTTDSTKYGIIVASTILKRYAEVCVDDPAPIQKHFGYIIDMTEGDMALTGMLYQELSIDRPNSPALNQMLYTVLNQSMKILVSTDNDEKLERFGLETTEGTEGAIQFYEAVTQMKQKHTLTLSCARTSTGLKSSAYIFTRGALRLYLESADACDQDNMNVFNLPLRIFDGIGEDLTKTQIISILYLAHNWIQELLNHYGDTKIENLWKRLENLIQIDDMLVDSFKEDVDQTSFELAPTFSKVSQVVKKSSSQDDKSSFFINELRNYFIPPRQSMIMMLITMEPPFDDLKFRFLSKLLFAYEYLITPEKKTKDKTTTQPQLFHVEKISHPPLEIVKWIANTLLPNILESDHNMAPMIVIQTINVLSAQFSLPEYKREAPYANLLDAICGHHSMKKCFKYFSDMIKDSQKIEIQFALIKLLHTILHSGTGRINQHSNEVEALNNHCRRLLMSSNPVLPVKMVKPVLSLFFEHNPDPISDVRKFAREILKPELYKGDEQCEEWPSLQKKTAQYFFQNSFAVINKQFHEIATKSKKATDLDEQSVLAILDRINELGVDTKALLQTTAAFGIPSEIQKYAIKQGDAWIVEVTQLLGFIKDAFEVDSGKVKDFMNVIKMVRKYINSKIKWIRDNTSKKEKALASLLPTVSKNMTIVAYKMQQVIKDTEGSEGIRLQVMQDRDLEGNFV